MDLQTILIILSAVLTVVSIVAAGAWKQIKSKFSQAKELLVASANLIQALVDALEDDKINEGEVAILKAKWEGVKAAFKALFKKEVEELI